MNDVEKRVAAKKFAADWEGKGYEKGDTQNFWIELLGNVLGVEQPTQFIKFEKQIKLGHTSFIDGMISKTKVLIEQKSLGKNLKQASKQSDGNMLTPYEQAKRYNDELPYSMRSRWIVVCNFAEFHVHDMDKPSAEPEVIYLKDLEKDYYRLQFLVDQNIDYVEREQNVSLEAGRLVGKLYDALLKQYKNPDDEGSLKSLNVLCVRLVFCFYAEDAGVFKKRNQFRDYLKQYQVKDFRRALIDVFKILATHEDKRDKYLDADLADFPYVNGGLFSDEEIEIPQIDEEIRDIILNQASGAFDWREISPTIFGAVFESTLNPETRKSGGMHYTSVENIHKVIDPLFLDNLREELVLAKEKPVTGGARTKALNALHDKIANLKFLDPACGSGNFLTETYLCLRRIENEILKVQLSDSITWGTQLATVNQVLLFGVPIKVTLDQFYGIEINDFAVEVAKTALWIAESQMMRETEDIIAEPIPFLPLQTITKIVEANALRIDWESVVSKSELNYIMGNPPFMGYSLQTKEQKADILSVYVDEKGKPYKTAGKIDYVAGWYFKAACFMQGTNIRTAFVGTNSITQGEQVAGVWKPLYERFGVHIDFAWRTFKWESEAIMKAAVHVVIVGFSCSVNKRNNIIYLNDGTFEQATNVNPYLLSAPVTFVESKNKSLCVVPEMVYGNKPTDGGNLFLNKEERDLIVEKDSIAAKYIKQIYGATEFLNNKLRYCLWLVDASPADIRKSAFLADRVSKVRSFRLASPKRATKDSADTPSLFQEVRQPNSDYVIVPCHSSENRNYIPIGFETSEVIVTNAVQIIPNADLYHFGVLTSNVHMAWMRAVAGRLEMRYRYSKDIVYNNFPWCEPTEAQRAKIEKTAQGILDARALYPDSSLADLYDVKSMKPELLKAHKANDRAVMEAYGFSKNMSESEIVAELMKMYQKLVRE